MKRTYIFGTLGLLALIAVLITNNYIKNSLKEHTYEYKYKDTSIIVDVYTREEEKANEVVKGIDEIIEYYTKVTDKENHYDNLVNLYDIKNNESEEEYLTIDENLKKLINLGIEWSSKSDKIQDITNICDEPIEIKDNKIANKHYDINLDNITLGYVIERIGEHLASRQVNTYKITYDNNYKLGNYHTYGKYKIGLKNNGNSDVFKTIKLTNKCINTKNSSLEEIKSITVISSDSSISYILSNMLDKISVEEGKELIKGNNIDIIWYMNDDTIVSTDGVSDYE